MKINYIEIPSNTIGIIVEYEKITESNPSLPHSSVVLNREIISQNLIRAFDGVEKFFLPIEEGTISEITVVSKN
jgi:hypothetical protein